tara:strand:+ start:172 stop:612 length:441 start_codon:yes stop_codon:yes gene_type:complete
MKVVRIEENGTCRLINYKPGDKLEGQYTDHEALMGLEFKGLKLGMWGLEWTQETPPPDDMINGIPGFTKGWDEEAKNKYNTYSVNKVAMKLLKEIKYHGRSIDYPGCIKGPVLLYDDATDMTIEKWKSIQAFIKKRNKRQSRRRRY